MLNILNYHGNKNQSPNDTTPHPLKITIIKGIGGSNKDVENLEPSHTTIGNVKCCLENTVAVLQKVKQRLNNSN